MKKLGWSPDIIHCHGWITSLIPMYIKTSYAEHPLFMNSKVVLSVYDDYFSESLDDSFARKIKMDGITAQNLKFLKQLNYSCLMAGAISYADGIIKASEDIDSDVAHSIKRSGKPVLEYQQMDEYIDAYADFYNELMIEDGVLAD